MRLALKISLTLIFVLITAFCCFAFLASRELEPANKPDALANPFRWLYGGTAVACVVAIATVWRANLRWALTVILVLITTFCCFCFVASGVEPSGPFAPFRWLYGTGIIASVAAIAAVWVVKATRRQA
jgi:hypothetical protein